MDQLVEGAQGCIELGAAAPAQGVGLSELVRGRGLRPVTQELVGLEGEDHPPQRFGCPPRPRRTLGPGRSGPGALEGQGRLFDLPSYRLPVGSVGDIAGGGRQESPGEPGSGEGAGRALAPGVLGVVPVPAPDRQHDPCDQGRDEDQGQREPPPL